MKGNPFKYKNVRPQLNKSNSTQSGPSQSNYYQLISDINSYANIQDLSNTIKSQSNPLNHHFINNSLPLSQQLDKDSKFEFDLFNRPIYNIPQYPQIRYVNTVENKHQERVKFWDMMRNYQEKETQVKGSDIDYDEKQTCTFRKQSTSKQMSSKKMVKIQIKPVIKEQQKEEIKQNSNQNEQEEIKPQPNFRLIKAVNHKNPFIKRKRRQYKPDKSIAMQIQDTRDLGKKGYCSTLEFVQFQSPQQDQSRKYPIRMSRMAPLRPYFCERVDYRERGYWIQKQQ